VIRPVAGDAALDRLHGGLKSVCVNGGSTAFPDESYSVCPPLGSTTSSASITSDSVTVSTSGSEDLPGAGGVRHVSWTAQATVPMFVRGI
jgi:hypothetical protein